ncbi:MAG: hypothetical protein V2I24_09405 [Halieaceae bacterium]|jgi:hypothetical protein|nr:hypothetical protein [Halieaceae bacterium]
MTENEAEKPTRQRRDMVRELGEAVLDAIRGAVADAIRNDPTFINRALLQQAMEPHIADTARRVANSEEFTKAIEDRLTADLFDSFKRRQPPEPTASLAPSAPEPEMPLVECSVEDCNRVGESVNECQRASCPFTIKDDLPWR